VFGLLAVTTHQDHDFAFELLRQRNPRQVPQAEEARISCPTETIGNDGE